VSSFKLLALLLLLLLPACRKNLPPLPGIEVSEFSGPVRTQIDEASQSVAARPGDGPANGRLAMLYHAYRLDAPALVLYRRAQILDSNDVRWFYLPALIDLRLSQFDPAAAALRSALKLDPGRPVLSLRLAEALTGLKRSDEAIALYRDLIARGQALPYAHFGLGRLLDSTNRRTEAFSHFETAIRLAPGFKECHFAYGQALRRAGKAAEAQHQFALHRTASPLDPPLEDPYRSELLYLDISSQGHLSRASVFDQAGNLPAAVLELERCLDRYPRNLGALVSLVSLHARLGNPAAAEFAYREAAAVNPNEPAAHFNWANTLAAQGRYLDAVAAVRLALAANPQFPNASTLLGDLLAATGQPPAAEKAYRDALRLRPADPVAALGLGRILVHNGLAAEALPLLEIGRSAPGPAAIRAHRVLVEACRQLGQTARARQALEVARPVIMSLGSMEDNTWLSQVSSRLPPP
jgi:tetratricopeptide (TPR) repeat protein